MKILHISDLHLGKIVLEQSMIEDQKYILNQIISLIKKESVEVLLISGDIYDRSIPPVEAVKLLNDFLVTLTEMNIKTFIIAGNHDSKERLNFGNKILEAKNIYIEGTFNGKLKKVTLSDSYGELNIYMLPFTRPNEVSLYYDEEFESYQDAIKKIIDETLVDKSKRNIILVHQFVTSGTIEPVRSESENKSLGGIENIDVDIFKDFDYVALGHIHGPQKLKLDTVRYAGSPLKYSFSECHQKKSAVLIDYTDELKFDLVPLIPLRDMREIKGPIDLLISKEVSNLGNREDYIKAILTDEEELYDPIGKLRTVYPNILRLEIENKKTAINLSSKTAASGNIKERLEIDLFKEFYENQNNIPLNEKQINIVNNIIKEVKNETDKN